MAVLDNRVSKTCTMLCVFTHNVALARCCMSALGYVLHAVVSKNRGCVGQSRFHHMQHVVVLLDIMLL